VFFKRLRKKGADARSFKGWILCMCFGEECRLSIIFFVERTPSTRSILNKIFLKFNVAGVIIFLKMSEILKRCMLQIMRIKKSWEKAFTMHTKISYFLN
jgi:hypothetical protein